MVIASEFWKDGHLVCGEKKRGRPSKIGQEMPMFGLRSSAAMGGGNPALRWLGADQTHRPKPYKWENIHLGSTGRWYEDDGRLLLSQHSSLRQG